MRQNPDQAKNDAASGQRLPSKVHLDKQVRGQIRTPTNYHKKKKENYKAMTKKRVDIEESITEALKELLLGNH